MKTIKLLAMLLPSCISLLHAQTVTLQPDATAGKDALIINNNSTTNYGTSPDLMGVAWTIGGVPFISRSLLQFDLSTVPTNATITSATLSLYCNTSSANTQLHSSLSGSNVSYLSRITAPWGENSVTWSNQPSTTSTGQITLAQSTSSTQDYPSINLTSMVQGWVTTPSTNYGIMLSLVTEAYYRSLIFASSDHPTAALRPKLVINYTLPCITFQPDAAAGKDAMIITNNPTTNYGTSPDQMGVAWTIGGAPFVARSLIEFNVSSIPASATVVSATLDLYCNTTSANTQLHSSLSGSNISLLLPVTAAWNENTVTWSNQPATTSTGAITLNQSTSSTQDYTGINVTSLAQSWVSSPSTNYGLMQQLITESYYRSLIFASSDHPTAARRPRLTICYATYPPLSKKAPVTGLEQRQKDNFTFALYPNPANGPATVEFSNPAQGPVKYAIYNIKGELVESQDKGILPGGHQMFQVMQTTFDKGIYFIDLNINGSTYHQKLVVF